MKWHVSFQPCADGWEWRAYHGPDFQAGKTKYATFADAATGAAVWLRSNGVKNIEPSA